MKNSVVGRPMFRLSFTYVSTLLAELVFVDFGLDFQLLLDTDFQSKTAFSPISKSKQVEHLNPGKRLNCKHGFLISLAGHKKVSFSYQINIKQQMNRYYLKKDDL